MYCAAPPNLNGLQFLIVVEYMNQLLFCDVKENCSDGCKCENHPSQPAIRVSCDKMSNLPEELPAFPSDIFHTQYTYVIVMTNSRLKNLKMYSYLNQTSHLNLSNNTLAQIEANAWEQLQNASIIRLDHNQLRALPSEIQYVNLPQLKENSPLW